MPRDSARTRQALLDAARAEFAEHGIAGARVDRIAASARVNKERIYAYFGSKEGLFDATFAQAMADITAEVELEDDVDFSAYVERKAAYHRTHPETARLHLWDALERSPGEPAAAEQRREIYRRKAKLIAEAFDLPIEEARYVMLLSMALGTMEGVWANAAELILGPGHDRKGLRDFIIETARRAATPLEEREP